jgi:hypothetical protein
MEILTVEKLKSLERGIFAQGEVKDDPTGCNMANTGKMMRWVAVRGDIHDWAIYCQNPHYIDSTDPDVLAVGYGGVWDWQKIAYMGDKVHRRGHIQHLVPCDDEAYKMYRH